MKKLSGITLLAAMFAMVMTVGVVSADNDNEREENHGTWKSHTMEKASELMKNRKEIRDGWGNFHDEFGHLNDYLQTDLTVEEK